MTIAKVLAVSRVSPPLLVVKAEDGTVLERSLPELTAGGYRCSDRAWKGLLAGDQDLLLGV
jgi:hypothetical protein